MDYFNVVLKTIIFYFLLIALIRLLGKREVGEISVFDLVVLLIIADIATMGINYGWREVIYSILSLITLLGLQKIIAYFALKYPKFRVVIDYKPSIIMYNGKLNLKEMRKQSYTIHDFISQARNNDIMDLNEINMAILEPNGQLSVYKKEEYKKEILPVIISGEYEKENIEMLKLSIIEVKSYLESNKMILKKINYLSSDGENFFLLKEL